MCLVIDADQREALDLLNTESPLHKIVPIELEDGRWVLNAAVASETNAGGLYAFAADVIDPIHADSTAHVTIDRDLVRLRSDVADFRPTDIPGLLSWVELDDLADGDVATWTDRSGNGNHGSQSTSNKRPVKSASGVLFDGSDDALYFNGEAPSYGGVRAASTVLIVAMPTTVAAGTRTLHGVGSSSVSNPLLRFSLNANKLESGRRGNGEGTPVITWASTTNEVANVMKLFVHTVEGRFVSCYSNGANRIDEVPSESAAALTVNQVSLGSLNRNTEANFFQGYVKARITYSRKLTVTEMNRVGVYLGTLYTLSVTQCVQSTSMRITDQFASWWTRPMAAVYGDKVYVGGVSSRGTTLVSELGGPGVRMATDAFDADDHNTVSVLAPVGKPPLVFWNDHAGDTKLYWRKGTASGDFTTLGARQSRTAPASVAYSQPFHVPGTDEVLVFARVGLSTWGFFRTTDYFATAPAAVVTLVDFTGTNQCYFASTQLANGNLRFSIYGHPTNSSIHQIYYGHIDVTTGDVSTADGTVVANIYTAANLPLAPASLDLVYDPDPGGFGTRLFDISDGPEIEIVYASWTSTSNARYKYARYSAGAWTQYDLVATGDAFGYLLTIHYHGGASFERATAGGILYLSRENAGVWTIEKWVTADGGTTWTPTVEVTAPGSNKCIRPYALAASDPARFVYIDCTSYGGNVSDAYQNYTGDLVGVL